MVILMSTMLAQIRLDLTIKRNQLVSLLLPVEGVIYTMVAFGWLLATKDKRERCVT
jgi:hypothetical protein